MKEKVLRFVETKGTAKFAEIQKFIVDSKFGEGTYDNTKDGFGNKLYRGYFTSAFRQVSTSRYTSNVPVGYFMTGDNRLEKTARGIYKTIRG